MPTKGKVPPQLRPYLFRKGQTTALAVRSKARAAGSRARSAASHAGGMLSSLIQRGVGVRPNFVQMGVNYLLGRATPTLLDTLGADRFLSPALNSSLPPAWVKFADTRPPGYSIGMMLASMAGAGGALKAVVDQAKDGKMKAADLNFWIPWGVGSVQGAQADVSAGSGSFGW